MVGATERTRDGDGRTDRPTGGRAEWNQYTPQQLRCARGMKIAVKFLNDKKTNVTGMFYTDKGQKNKPVISWNDKNLQHDIKSISNWNFIHCKI